MKKLFKTAKTLVVIAGLLALALQTSAAHGQDWDRRDFLRAELTSFEQVPSVLAPSRGNFEAQINEDGTISFELSYANMSSAVTQAGGSQIYNAPGVVRFTSGSSLPPKF